MLNVIPQVYRDLSVKGGSQMGTGFHDISSNHQQRQELPVTYVTIYNDSVCG